MVVDFELATGVKIVPVAAASEADVTWAEQCQNFKCTTKKVDKICGLSPLSIWALFLKKGPHVVSLWLRVSPRTAVSPETSVPACRLDDRKKPVPSG